MLILQRKKDTAVNIGDNIRVSISDIGTDWVKLAIDAPADVKIVRSELLEAATLNKESSDIDKNNLNKLKNLVGK